MGSYSLPFLFPNVRRCAVDEASTIVVLFDPILSSRLWDGLMTDPASDDSSIVTLDTFMFEQEMRTKQYRDRYNRESDCKAIAGRQRKSRFGTSYL